MNHVTIDGRKMNNRESVHPYLKSVLQLDGYYGDNLDALWDAVSTFHQSLKIELIHREVMIENLGSYGVAIIELFEEAAQENRFITFCK
ncbi:barstar family protein [Oceanobacillus sp. CAU 1775]